MIPTITTWLFNRQLRDGTIRFPDVVKFCARELDAIAIEVPRTTYSDWSPAGLRDLKRMMHDNGLFCAAIAAQNHFNCLTPIERRREVHLTKDFIDHARFLGCRVLNIFHAGWGDREQGRRLKSEMMECLREVTSYAEDQGVILALESHGPLTDNVAEFRELFEQCPSEYLRLNFDTGNLHEGPEGNLKLLDLAVHAHVKPRYRDLEGNVRDAEVPRVLGALAATGFRGTVTLEQVDGDPIENLPAVYAAFKEMLAGLQRPPRESAAGHGG
jgi:sugar phosphate isomerase/epimerase